jgi:hypothetical protein
MTRKKAAIKPSRFDLKMPFGKYAGCPVSELPTTYLVWVQRIAKTYGLRRAVGAEINRRDWLAGVWDHPKPIRDMDEERATVSRRPRLVRPQHSHRKVTRAN